ncbi:MAG: hypothetical protein GY820_01495 [Gammaproteobacteria bacterium]|nr:hypothetical protein [Gammaproteobacteria bacterium]
MRFIKHLTTWLLLLTVLTASGLVSAKVASGSQNLSGGLHQAESGFNSLIRQAKIDFNYDAASGSPVVTKKGLGGNPFKGKTPKQIDEAFRKKGFDIKGTDPVAGKGSYINPKTGRKYYIDKGGKYKKGTELPHVDVHRPSDSSLPKRKPPLGDRLIE